MTEESTTSILNKIMGANFIVGLITIAIGASIIWFAYNSVINAAPGGGTVYGWFFIIAVFIGGGIALVGGLIVGAALVGFVTTSLVSMLGIKYFTILCIAIGIVILANLLIPPNLSANATVSNGRLYAGADFNSDIIKELAPGTSINLVSYSEIYYQRFPWFVVSVNDGKIKGYIWGGNLCPQDKWLNGLNNHCTNSALENKLEKYDESTTATELQIIEYASRTIPGIWYNERAQVYRYYEEGGNIVDYNGAPIGKWYLTVDKGRLILNRIVKIGKGYHEERLIKVLNQDLMLTDGFKLFSKPGSYIRTK